PKPTENFSTRTPQRRATMKWPNSWKVTSRPIVTISHQAEPKNSFITRPWEPESKSGDEAAGFPARRRVGLEDGAQVACRHRIYRVQAAFDRLGDRQERQPFSEERGDRLLVRRVQDGRGGAAGAQGVVGEGEAAEGGEVGRLEVEPRR